VPYVHTVIDVCVYIGEARRLYNGDLTDGTSFTVQRFAFTDPFDIFDDFASFKGCLSAQTP